jgi:hypothetical protein
MLGSRHLSSRSTASLEKSRSASALGRSNNTPGLFRRCRSSAARYFEEKEEEEEGSWEEASVAASRQKETRAVTPKRGAHNAEHPPALPRAQSLPPPPTFAAPCPAGGAQTVHVAKRKAKLRARGQPPREAGLGDLLHLSDGDRLWDDDAVSRCCCLPYYPHRRCVRANVERKQRAQLACTRSAAQHKPACITSTRAFALERRSRDALNPPTRAEAGRASSGAAIAAACALAACAPGAPRLCGRVPGARRTRCVAALAAPGGGGGEGFNPAACKAPPERANRLLMIITWAYLST